MVGFLARDVDPEIDANARQGFLDESVRSGLADAEQVTDFFHGELFDEAKREHRLQSWWDSTDGFGHGLLSHMDEVLKRIEIAR